MTACTLLGLLFGLASPAGAESLSGVCPDGSMFVVQDLASVPCAHAKLVDPSELPPMRPELLPRPYNWYVDQESRNQNNPYNLLDSAEKLREARRALQRAELEPSARTEGAPPERSSRPDVEPPRLAESELRDLVRLVALRQQVAPAELRVEDVYGGERLRIQWAHSNAFAALTLDALGLDPAAHHVIAFLALAPSDAADFHPNFLVVQDARTYRPDPDQTREIGFLVGAPGTIPSGRLALGYLVVPAGFDPARELELWWNDRSARVLLAPDAEAPLL